MAKKMPPSENRLPELVEDAAPRMLEVQHHAADLERDEILAAGIDLGRLEAMDFFLTIGTSASLSIFENVKKSKTWRLLRNPNSSDGQKFQSLEEFCQVKLGKGYKRLQELAGNKNTLGAEAFEQAERLGLRQGDYNLIKALPAPKQEIIKEALAEGSSKEEVQRALRELAAVDQKEITSLTQKYEEAQGDLQARQQRLDEITAKYNRAEEKLISVKTRLERMPPDQRASELVVAVQDVMSVAQTLIIGPFKKAIEAVLDHDGSTGSDHRAVMSGFIAQLEDATDALRVKFALSRLKGVNDDPFAPLPDDFMEKDLARVGLTMPKPINIDENGKLLDPSKLSKSEPTH